MARRLNQLPEIDSSHLDGTDFIVGYRPSAKGIRFTLNSILTRISAGLVSSVFGRTGNVVAQAGDYSASDITGLGTAATKNVGTTAGTVAAGDHGHTTLTMDSLILRNPTTGTLWKLELKGATDATTEPVWTPQ
jgi:hypothetical protein